MLAGFVVDGDLQCAKKAVVLCGQFDFASRLESAFGLFLGDLNLFFALCPFALS